MSIKENLDLINEKIKIAAEKSGRKREDVLLLAVSKTVDVPRIKEAVDLGLVDLGENKPQEINWKYFEIENVRWHQIGHLQTNKVKYIIDKVCLIHSVDSLKLAEEISKRAKAKDITMDVLVEINIAGEEAKSGVPLSEAEELAVEISKLDNIRVKGLMTVAPFVENPEDNREYFKQMKKLFVDIKEKNYNNIDMQYLSMGMTNDYEIAVEEGANIVRIGTGLFGARDYSK
ncbi:MAG: YggS family pyridoxal phosphate-dependent enzyme [Lachnospirales bacterium]